MVVLANAGLALSEIGTFEALRYIGFALTAFWVNALANAYLRIRQVTQHVQRWFVLFLLIILLGALLVFALFAEALPLLGAVLLDVSDLSYGLAFGTFLLGSLAAGVIEQEAIADQAGARLLVFATTSYGLQVGLFVLPLLLGYPLWLAMWGLAASAVYRLGWVFARYMRTSDGRLPLAAERAIFWRTASGLSVYGLAALAVTAVDHALVGYYSDGSTQALAIWRYGAQELPLLLGIVSAANATSLAEMQHGLEEMLTQLRRRCVKLVRVFMPLSIVLMLISPFVIPLLFSPEFYPAHVIFNTMLLLVPTRLIMTTPLLISLDLQRQMTFAGIAANIINIVVSLALVGSLGMLGIALGTLIAFSLERLAVVVLLSQKQHILQSYLPVGEWVVYALLLLVAYLYATDFEVLGVL